MTYRDFFTGNENFSENEEKDKKCSASIDDTLTLSEKNEDEKLHPGDIIMDKGNIVGIQSIRKSLTGGETLDLVNENGKNKVVPKSVLTDIVVIKSGNKLKESSLDKIPVEDKECTDETKKASLTKIGADSDKVLKAIKSESSEDNSKEIASKLSNIAVTINSILDCMKKNSLNRTGMSSYRVNTI